MPVAADERLGVILFQSTGRTVHVVQASNSTHPFTKKLAWSSHRFYFN